MKRSSFRTFLTLLFSGVFITAAVWLVLNRQYALDTFTNWTFNPTSSVAAVAERTQLTDEGHFIFYATRPEILEQEAFNVECPRQEAASPILGCYTSEDRIYVYNVTDAQLDGIKEVTTAHEVLHAVWYRMDDKQKRELETHLRAAYEEQANESLQKRMEYYERTEPGEFVNELYAILGTEVANLGDLLEAHYAKYFDRSAVLALHSQYNTRYTELTEKSEAYLVEMERLSKEIDAATERYNASVATFSSDVESFNQRATSGSFSSASQFNAERAALMARSNQLDADRQAINTAINAYNAFHAEYEKLGEQLEVLNQGMDSYHTIEEVPAV